MERRPGMRKIAGVLTALFVAGITLAGATTSTTTAGKRGGVVQSYPDLMAGGGGCDAFMCGSNHNQVLL
jgi:trimethylamine:corrinoid methyltransferase-like protein